MAILDNKTYDYLSDLTQIPGTDGITVYVSNGTTMDDGGGGTYRWSDNAVNTVDGVNIIAYTGSVTGRWIRRQNNNYKTGNVSFTTILGTGSYTVAHGLAYTPSYIGLEGSTDPAIVSPHGVTNITATTFTIKLGGSLTLGTATFRFMATR